jgi:hypothetical protein
MPRMRNRPERISDRASTDDLTVLVDFLDYCEIYPTCI